MFERDNARDEKGCERRGVLSVTQFRVILVSRIACGVRHGAGGSRSLPSPHFSFWRISRSELEEQKWGGGHLPG